MQRSNDEIILSTSGRIATITLNVPKKLNALNQSLYYRLAEMMREVAARDDIYITILTGNGRFFSAGADISASYELPANVSQREHTLRGFVANNIDLTHAFYSHPKILVTALNGPAIGLSAALIAFSDFVYAAPHAFLLTPFSSLGLVAEGGASVGFVQRLGISKANEALIMSKKIGCDELVQVGFVNKVFGGGGPGEPTFLQQVLDEVEERLGSHLNQDSLLRIKALVRRPERAVLDGQTVAEVLGGLTQFVEGVPQKEFAKIASGEKKHKL